MKFFNNVTPINTINEDYVVLDNYQSVQSAIVITIQLINNSSTQITVAFKRQKFNEQSQQWQQTAYSSKINIKSGTTILDHIVVVNPRQRYLVSSNSNQLVVSCSYGI